MIERSTRGSISGPEQLVPGRSAVVEQPLAWFPLGPADRPLVGQGETVAVGQPILERARETYAADLVRPSGRVTPGQSIERGEALAGRGRRSTPIEDRGRILSEIPPHRMRVAFGRHLEVVVSPIDGTVEVVDAGVLGIRADGTAFPAAVAWGRPVRGPLRFLVDTPEAELRASAIDVSAAGSVIVAGARIDVEALTRARATGVNGIIAGGISGRDLQQLEASEARQRAGLVPTAPFALIVLDGFGGRPIPAPMWAALGRAASTEVTVLIDPPAIVLDRSVPRPASGARVRVAAGEFVGATGHLLEMLGPVRRSSGVYRLAARVRLDRLPGRPGSLDTIVPIADLERFE